MRLPQNSFLHGQQPKTMGLYVFLLLFGAQFLCFGFLYYQAFSSEEAHLRSEVAQLALVASQFVDVERHEELTDSGQIDSALYQKLLAPLVRFHLATPGIHYLVEYGSPSKRRTRVKKFSFQLSTKARA